MRSALYYAIAAFLVLASVPMYRYILSRTSTVRHPAPAPVIPAPVVSVVPLLPGEVCRAGFVYIVRGNVQMPAVDVAGRSVRCTDVGAVRPR